MNYLEAAKEIADTIPGAKVEFEHNDKLKNAFTVIDVFTNQFRKIITIKDSKILGPAISEINRIYLLGDALLRNAVESIFIHALSSMVASCNHTLQQKIMVLVDPAILRTYHQQIYKSGI